MQSDRIIASGLETGPQSPAPWPGQRGIRTSAFMTRDRVSFRSNEGWYLVVGFATAIVAAVAVAWASYNDITQYYRWVGWVTHTQSVLVTLDGARGDTFSSVASLQTYFQNGDRKTLDRLELQLSELLRKTSELRALTVDNDSQQRRLDEVDQSERRLTTLAHRAVHTAGTMRGEDAVKAPLFGELGSTLYLVSAQFDPIFAAEQALLTKRTANARTASHRSAMVMGIGGGIIFTWLLLVGGYAGLTTNRLKQTAVDRKKADARFRSLLETAPDAMVLVGRGRPDRTGQRADRKALRLRPHRVAWQHGRDAGAAALSRQASAAAQPVLRRLPKSARWAPAWNSMACARTRPNFRSKSASARSRPMMDGWWRAPSATSPTANAPRPKSPSLTTASARCSKPRPTRWCWSDRRRPHGAGQRADRKALRLRPRRVARQYGRDAGAAALSRQASAAAQPVLRRSQGASRWAPAWSSTACARTAPSFPIEISLSPIETDDGTLVSSAIRDITDRKRAEDKVARA